jgi:glyoxylase-like metal-dependent hydrolase (beta-lactamase superfamily II)/rhodanese-related sulfurtransferase
LILRSYYLGCLAHASYMIGDRATGVAAVIDPQRDVEQYLADAAAEGLTIRHVLETHFHADFLSGHLELEKRTGAAIYFGARASADFSFTPLAEGDAIEMGRVRLVILETPGHTPESISILAYDLDVDATAPAAVFTGDTLFIGDVGRPDLMAAKGMSPEELAALLHDSLHRKLLTLPDATRVYPAHGAGSLCGRALKDERVSTIGREKEWNYACAPMPRAEFIRLLTSDLPEAPAYFPFDAQRNREVRPTLDEVLSTLRPLDIETVLELAAGGATLLDVREPGEFARAHLAGAINIGLSGKYATWAGSLLDRARPIVLVANPGRETEAALRLGRIGFDDIAGYLAGGLDAARGHQARVRTGDRLTPQELAVRTPAPFVLDVRERGEREAKQIPGTTWVPLGQLGRRLGELPGDREIVVHCASGYRSSIAASLLRRVGFERVADLLGGIEAWAGTDLPVLSAAPDR